MGSGAITSPCRYETVGPHLSLLRAILATGLMILAALSFFTGLILDTVVRARKEVRRLHYLSLPAVGE